ncbi:hypothetical protein NOR_01154 [Metarhizium rileyi]|uniref:Uncharacterized protein n=1 Tax=Metarhizium rileyi (strain RCEF 4871) TaxID=1649241 RepID=A0A162KG95_METRR|nr:hypothetical protein NOR_01154 [Metarhizium rileyi RCEF 4871]
MQMRFLLPPRTDPIFFNFLPFPLVTLRLATPFWEVRATKNKAQEDGRGWNMYINHSGAITYTLARIAQPMVNRPHTLNKHINQPPPPLALPPIQQQQPSAHRRPPTPSRRTYDLAKPQCHAASRRKEPKIICRGRKEAESHSYSVDLARMPNARLPESKVYLPPWSQQGLMA